MAGETLVNLNRPNWDMPPLVFRPKHKYIHKFMEPRLAFIFSVFQEIHVLMSAAPSNCNFNLALGYKQPSIEGLTRKTQHSSLIRKSWICPF